MQLTLCASATCDGVRAFHIFIPVVCNTLNQIYSPPPPSLTLQFQREGLSISISVKFEHHITRFIKVGNSGRKNWCSSYYFTDKITSVENHCRGSLVIGFLSWLCLPYAVR